MSEQDMKNLKPTVKKVRVSEEVVSKIVGQKDKYVRLISTGMNVDIAYVGGELTVSGEQFDVFAAIELVNYLIDIVLMRELISDDVYTALRLAQNGELSDMKDVTKERVKVSGNMKYVSPKSKTQREYLKAIKDKDMVFAYGPAGTGKTFLAVAMAVHYYLEKRVQRIVLTRPAVEAGEKLGFLPGDLADKINPYLRPLHDALHAMLDSELVIKLMERGVIEVAPLAFMRGRTLSNAFVILDEAQNTTASQMKMFLTRLGFGSKAVVTGDTTQVDLPREQDSGLTNALHKLHGLSEIGFIELSERDVVRHPLVTKIIKAYDKS